MVRARGTVVQWYNPGGAPSGRDEAKPFRLGQLLSRLERGLPDFDEALAGEATLTFLRPRFIMAASETQPITSREGKTTMTRLVGRRRELAALPMRWR